MTATNLTADRQAIRRDLVYMTRRWHELGRPALLEIRAFKEDRTPQINKFDPAWMDDAVEFAASMNAMGFNIYAVRNPIKIDCKGSASDDDILAAFFLWADCDDEGAAGNVKRFDGPKWTASVVTGKTPSTRVHVYWELQEPCLDLAAWRALQSDIAGHFKSDRSVINPSRIMRVGGTVSWPASKKREKGYVDELTAVYTEYKDAREPVRFDQMRRVFAAAPQPQAPEASAYQWLDEGDRPQKTAEDYADILRRARTDGEKHTGVRDLSASLAGSGVPRHLCEAIIREACPVWDANVESLIDSAYAKFRKPEPRPTHTPNFDHAPAPTPSDPAPASAGWKVQRADEFTADFVAPEYIIDGVVQRGRVYTLTAPTGSGKTAVMLYASTSIATGGAFCEREVEAGDVLFMAGENPDDVRARVIATMEFHGIDPRACRLHFIAGTFSIRADLERLREEAAKLPNLILVVIDTFAAYFDGDDENSNAQALDFARLVRKIAAFDAKPAVIMPAHPVKNATRGNLSPKGGSSLLNEVDGNLTLWNEAGILSLHWQGKFRGAEFEPLHFELQKHESSLICDSQGRIIPTILAKPLLEIRALQIATENLSREHRVLLSIADAPALSIRDRCVTCGLTLQDGRAHKSGMNRIITKLAEQKLIRRLSSNWELTKDGERVVEMLKSGQPFAKEI